MTPSASQNTNRARNTDDQIYPLTRWVALLVVPFLWAAFIILFFYPESSGVRFAWAIKPEMTARYLGAGYLGGSWLFINAIIGKRWHRVQVGFLPVTSFTWFMLLATLLHWDRFATGNLGFVLWLVLYIVTPFLVPALWFYNRKTDSGAPETRDVSVPSVVLWVFRLAGIGALIFVVLGFIYPDLVIQIWPWTLSVLTARVMCGWISLLGLGALMMSREKRWSGWKVPMESILLWHLLVLVAIAINPADFTNGVINWYTLLVGFLLLFSLVFYPWMELHKRKA
jgi:hypothetical protein